MQNIKLTHFQALGNHVGKEHGPQKSKYNYLLHFNIHTVFNAAIILIWCLLFTIVGIYWIIPMEALNPGLWA